MCGIAGTFGFGDAEAVGRMLAALVHRGPDAGGVHADGEAVLGSRRLRILDLSARADQPMADPEGRVHVVYNGEIYNEPELRRELEADGVRFRTTSDTELIPHLYLREGAGFARRLNGVFAIALWDARRRVGFLYRDPVGVKPLHLWEEGGRLAFASEIKGLLALPEIPRRPNPEALHRFLNVRFAPGEETLLSGIRRLPPGHFLRWREGGSELRRYWDWPEPDVPVDPEACVEETRRRLRAAVARQLRADVPVGVYLSGGTDSSTLAALAVEASDQPVRTFTLGFGEPTDELADARAVAARLGTDHRETVLTRSALDAYPEAVAAAEEPKVNGLQGFVLARWVSGEVKVALSGLGGDEIFGGYDIYRYLGIADALRSRAWLRPMTVIGSAFGRATLPVAERFGGLPFDNARRAIEWGGGLAATDPTPLYTLLRNGWDRRPRWWRALYDDAFASRVSGRIDDPFRPWFADAGRDRYALRRAALACEFERKMVDDFLLNGDRNSMAHALEERVPFLDLDLAAFARRLPPSLLFDGGPKGFLRKVIAPWVPEGVLDKPKWGFTFDPVHRFRVDLRERAREVLTDDRIRRTGIFRPEWIRRILDHPADRRLRWHLFLLWTALGLAYWWDRFVEGGDEGAWT